MMFTENEKRDFIRKVKNGKRDYIRRMRKGRRDLVRQSMIDAQQFVVRWGNKHGDGYKTNAEAVAVARGLERALQALERMEV